MKKILFPLLTLLLLLSIAGCSTNSPNNNDAKPKYQDPEFGVSTKQLIEDITKNETIADCLSSKFVEETPVEYVSHEITKRKIDKDDKEDIIDCTIECKTEYISGKMEVKLVYHYYDVGGWAVEETTVESVVMQALKAPNGDAVTKQIEEIYQSNLNNLYQTWLGRMRYVYDASYIYDSYPENEDYYEVSPFSTDLTIIECEFPVTKGDVTYETAYGEEARIHISFTSAFTKLEGYISLLFNENTGWDWTAKINGRQNSQTWPTLILTSQEDTGNTASILGTYVYYSGSDYLEIVLLSNGDAKTRSTSNGSYKDTSYTFNKQLSTVKVSPPSGYGFTAQSKTFYYSLTGDCLVLKGGSTLYTLKRV